VSLKNPERIVKVINGGQRSLCVIQQPEAAIDYNERLGIFSFYETALSLSLKRCFFSAAEWRKATQQPQPQQQQLKQLKVQ